MDLGLAGARALVGGGSGGLGGAVGATLAGEGARVALAARPSDRLDAAVASLAGAVAVPVDLATSRRPGRRGRPDRATRSAVWTCSLVNSGGPPPGTFDELDEAAWDTRHRRHPVGRHPAHPCGVAAPARQRPPVDPREPVVVGPRADPRADRVEPAASGPGRAHQVAVVGDRAGRGSTVSPRVGSRRGRIAEIDAAAAKRTGATIDQVIGRDDRPHPARDGTATPPSSAGWRPSSCRPRPRTSPARSSRSTAAWSGPCRDARVCSCGPPATRG